MFSRLDTIHANMKMAEQELLEKLHDDCGNKNLDMPSAQKRVMERHQKDYIRFLKLYQMWEKEEIELDEILDRTLK